MNPTHASILAIGTELTTGQITNRNAAWISEQLVRLGVEVTLHQTVPDDRALIRKALDHCAESTSMIFVTGGLGPTSDDFTREVIADWLQSELIFNEEVWQQVCLRLTNLGVPIALSNRQQCFFPDQAKILPNPNGTAAGFTATLGKTQIWVFPGPPREVATVWEQGIEAQIRKRIPERHPVKLFTWQCMGKSEAELGEITESILKGSGLQTGYRAHRPYVEIKVWCPEDQIVEKSPWIEKLENAISPWIITQQGEDLAERLIQKLKRAESIEIYDSGTGGNLCQRLALLLKQPQHRDLSQRVSFVTEWQNLENAEEWISKILNEADEETLTLAVGGFSTDGKGAIGMREENQLYRGSIVSPYLKLEHVERTQAYTVEIALKQWSTWLGAETTH